MKAFVENPSLIFVERSAIISWKGKSAKVGNKFIETEKAGIEIKIIFAVTKLTNIPSRERPFDTLMYRIKVPNQSKRSDT